MASNNSRSLGSTAPRSPVGLGQRVTVEVVTVPRYEPRTCSSTSIAQARTAVSPSCQDFAGKLDLVFPIYRAVLFVHGCYWHRHEGCSRAVMLSSNVSYWTSKFARNVDRDRHNFAELMALEWRVGVVWECWIGRQLDNEYVEELLAFLVDPKNKAGVGRLLNKLPCCLAG